MQKVEPIKDKELLRQIQYFLDRRDSKNAKRDALLFAIGVECGLRISDLITLRVYDVQGKKLTYRATKTNKPVEVNLSQSLQKRIKQYTKDMKAYDYLFPTRQSSHMSRQNASRIMSMIAEEFQLDNFNTHSLRKTFAYMFYLYTNGDIAAVQLALGHSSPVVTMRYLGIDEEYLEKKMKGFSAFN